jgi:asparagine synthase (glutamine-hydrolysing)
VLDVAFAGTASVSSVTDEEYVEELNDLLLKVVEGQMLSDVPLGAFLSGGIDSSTVVSLMQARSSNPVRTFTIGFEEGAYDEAKFARAVSAHLGTAHTELYVTAAEAMEVVPQLHEIYCEPFADSSQIPTYLVSKMASQHVKVSLSGDGGDEIFGGYTRYSDSVRRWKALSRIPGFVRRTLPSFVPRTVPASLGAAWARAGDRVLKGVDLLATETFDDFYLKSVSHWDPGRLVIDCVAPVTAFDDGMFARHIQDPVGRMMALDSITYLPDDILVKVDRAAMSVSLEGRMPFLDHRVAELAWRMPLRAKFRPGRQKWVLRQVLHKYVPASLFERPKMGFAVPLDRWLRGPLRDWAEDLLDESRLKSEGFLRPEPIRERWSQHLSGARNWQFSLWDVLMFQSWLAGARSV